MISARTNGSRTSRAQTRRPRTSAPLTERKTMRSRVQPPMRSTTSRELTGVVTERPGPTDGGSGLLVLVLFLVRRRRRRRLGGALLHALELLLEHVAERRTLAGRLALHGGELIGLGALPGVPHREHDAPIHRIHHRDFGPDALALLDLGA